MHLHAHRLLPLTIVTSIAVSSLSGCLTDDDKPGTPVLDAVRARTSLATLHLTGSAEYNATLTINGGASIVTTSADARTGLFAADIDLVDGANNLSVIATDAAGNASEPATAAIVREAPRAETVLVSIREPIIRADDGEILVSVDATNSEPGVDLRLLQVNLSIVEDTAFVPAPVVFNAVGHADVVINDRTAVGTFTVHAEAVVADDNGERAADEAAFTVQPGHPVNADFLTIVDNAAPHPAGEPIVATYTLTDAFGNDATSASSLVVTVNAANVSITDDGEGTVEIDGLVHAGSYLVRGHLADSDLQDEIETIEIAPNPELAGFNFVLSSSLIAEFGTVVFSATDGFGNAIDESSITTTFSNPTAITRNGAELTFNTPGSYSITACQTGTQLCDTEFISVQGLLDTVPPTVSVVIETPTGITNVVRGQRIVFRVDLTDDRALSSLNFVATFGNNGTCRATGGPILYDGTTSESSTFSFTVPTCAIPLDVVSIVAQASDQAGNTHNVANETLSVTDPFQLAFPGNNAQQAFLNTVVAFGSSINGPTGVAAEPLGGSVFVANGANGNSTNRAIGVTIDRVQFTLVDQNNQRFDLRGVRGAAASSGGNLFFGVQEVNNGGGGSSGIVRITNDLQRQTFVSSNTPGGQSEAITTNQSSVEQLVLSETTAPLTQPTALCMVISVQDHIWCYGNVDDTAGNATRLAEVEINGQRPRGIAIDGPDNGADLDVLFAALDNNTHVIRPFTFNADRSTLTAGTDIDISAFVNGNGQIGDLAVGPQPNENLYLVHRSQGRVLKIDRSTTPPTVSVFVSGLSSPSGLAFDGNSMLITDSNDNVVFRVIPDPAAPGIF